MTDDKKDEKDVESYKLYNKMFSKAIQDGIFDDGKKMVYHYLATVMMIEVYEEALRSLGCSAAELEKASSMAAHNIRETIAFSKGKIYTKNSEEV